jgi:hypothetical protein
MNREVIDLLHRAIGAIENPSDLSDSDRIYLVEDIAVLIRELSETDEEDESNQSAISYNL